MGFPSRSTIQLLYNIDHYTNRKRSHFLVSCNFWLLGVKSRRSCTQWTELCGARGCRTVPWPSTLSLFHGDGGSTSVLYWIWLLLIEEIEYSRSNWIRHLLPSRVGDFRPFLSDPGHSCPAAQTPQVPARCCCCVHTSACSCFRKHSTDMLSSLAETPFLQKKLSQAAKLIAHQLLGDGAAQRQSACRAPRLHLQCSHMMFKFKRDFLNIFF